MAQKHLDGANLLHYNSSKGCHEKLRQLLKPVKNRKVIENVRPKGYIGPSISNGLFNSVHGEPLNIQKWKNVENHCYLRSYLNDATPSGQGFDQNDCSEFETDNIEMVKNDKDEHAGRLLTAVLMPETQMISSCKSKNVLKGNLIPKTLIDDDMILQHAKLLADEAYAKLILNPVIQCMLNREPESGRYIEQKSAVTNMRDRNALNEMNYEWAQSSMIDQNLVDRTRLHHKSKNLGYTKHPATRCSSKKCGTSKLARSTLSIIANNLPPTRFGKWAEAVYGQATKNRDQIGESCKRHSLRFTTKFKRIPRGWGFSWSDDAICKKQVNRRPLPSLIH